MSSKPTLTPGWTVIANTADLEAHDRHDPAYCLIHNAWVHPIHTFYRILPEPGMLGDLARGVELLLVAIDEPDTRMMVSSVNQIVRAMNQIIATANDIRDELELDLSDDEDGNGIVH